MISFLGKFFLIFARPASRREELTELLQDHDDKTALTAMKVRCCKIFGCAILPLPT